MKKLLLLITLTFLSVTSYSQVLLTEDDFDEYISRITGRFSTELQAKRDSTKDNVLVRTVYFGDHDEGVWIYTQQGEYINGKYTPYRQRIYGIYQIDDYYIGLDIFQLPNETEYWSVIQDLPKIKNGITFKADLEKLKSIPIESYIYKDGCTIKIYKDSLGGFRGATEYDNCKGSFRGSTYTTTEFVVYPHEVISWERGWDDMKVQKWGPTQSPYIYTKVANH